MKVTCELGISLTGKESSADWEFPIMADYCVIADEGRLIYATHGHHFHEKNLPRIICKV